jgi:hypothetical protein
MRQEKLGRLVIGEPSIKGRRGDGTGDGRQGGSSGLGWWWLTTIPVLVVAIVVGWQTGWLPAQFVPRKVILRGCDLTGAAQLAPVLPRGAATYAEWWQAARTAKLDNQRWVTRISMRPLAGHTALLDVTERKPVLRLESAGRGYWLCDDGSLVGVAKEDKAAEFTARLKQFPSVKLDGISARAALADPEPIMTAAALCAAVLPGEISRLVINSRGEYTLFDRGGLEIRLGQPVDLGVKIGSLPKTLRAASAERAKLEYIDATGQRSGNRLVIYENLRLPVDNET